MHWQDIVLTAGQVIFIIALIPAIKHEHKPPFATSIINAGVLFGFVVVYISLSLWFASITTTAVGLLWLILAWQKKGKFR